MGTLTDLKKSGKKNLPGSGRNILVALVKDFTTISTPTIPGTDPGDEVTITEDHVFENGKGFKVLETTDEFNELTGEVVGDRDSRAASVSMAARHPGLEKEALEFAALAQGQDFIMLIPNRDGTYRQLGTEEDPMECQVYPGSGTKSGGYKGQMFTFSGYSEVFVYEGVVELESEIV